MPNATLPDFAYFFDELGIYSVRVMAYNAAGSVTSNTVLVTVSPTTTSTTTAPTQAPRSSSCELGCGTGMGATADHPLLQAGSGSKASFLWPAVGGGIGFVLLIAVFFICRPRRKQYVKVGFWLAKHMLSLCTGHPATAWTAASGSARWSTRSRRAFTMTRTFASVSS